MAKRVYRKTPRDDYATHKSHAKQRGVEFKMTFDEWLSVWTDSGHWNERGHRRGCYVMARYGDVGPYAVDNVKIILHEANSVEGRTGVPRTAEVRAKIGAAHQGRTFSAEWRAKISAAKRNDPRAKDHLRRLAEAKRGKPQTAEHAEKSRAALRLARIARKRAECPT
jgi:hypothetical protein